MGFDINPQRLEEFKLKLVILDHMVNLILS